MYMLRFADVILQHIDEMFNMLRCSLVNQLLFDEIWKAHEKATSHPEHLQCSQPLWMEKPQPAASANQGMLPLATLKSMMYGSPVTGSLVQQLVYQPWVCPPYS